MSELSDFIAEFLKSLADPVKIDLLKSLKLSRKNSKQIQDELDISQAQASQKINELKKAGIIISEKIENIQHYSLMNNDIIKLISIITSFVLELEKSRINKLSKLDDFEKFI